MSALALPLAAETAANYVSCLVSSLAGVTRRPQLGARTPRSHRSEPSARPKWTNIQPRKHRQHSDGAHQRSNSQESEALIKQLPAWARLPEMRRTSPFTANAARHHCRAPRWLRLPAPHRHTRQLVRIARKHGFGKNPQGYALVIPISTGSVTCQNPLGKISARACWPRRT